MPCSCLVPEGVLATRSRRNLSVLPQEICWVPARGAGGPEDERTTADGPAEVGGPRSTRRRGNARRARGVEPRRAREGGPGRGNGGAAVPADRNSRSRACEPSCDGGAEGDRQGADGPVCDDGRGCEPVDAGVVEGGVEQGRPWPGWRDGRGAARAVAGRVAGAAS